MSDKKNIFFQFIGILLVIILLAACSAEEVSTNQKDSVVKNPVEYQTEGGDVFQKSNQSTLKELSNQVSKDKSNHPDENTGDENSLSGVSIQATPTAVLVQPTEDSQQSEMQPTPVIAEATVAAQIDLSLPAEPRVGARAPEFALQSLDGSTMQITGFFGHPILISYWATWCEPCMNELNILGRISSEYQARGLQIITINAIEQDDLNLVQQIVTENGISFPVLLDNDDQFARSYQAMFFPTTYYVDQNGVIREIILGDTSEEEFRQKIELLLSGSL
jgi:cytochrome c biogenesis protein CcmG, thiol:disulfide interchange protein DsbE